MSILSAVWHQLNIKTIALFSVALIAGPFLALVLNNPVYYWDMLYCMTFMLGTLFMVALQSANKATEYTSHVLKWVGAFVFFLSMLAASFFFNHPASGVGTKLVYLCLGVLLPVSLYSASSWALKKLDGGV